MNTQDRARVLAALSIRQGKLNGITGADLAQILELKEREIRHAISALREEGIAVCGHPREGYYIAATAEELEATCAFLRDRAMHSLLLESRLRKLPLRELLGQIRLGT